MNTERAPVGWRFWLGWVLASTVGLAVGFVVGFAVGEAVVEAVLEAVEVAKRERPHLILLDIYLPKMDGIEVLKTIKEFDESIGVIMITAFREEDVARHALELGAFDYINKPFDFDYLERSLDTKLQMMLM